ncbi:MAG: glycosyltransferase [Pyrinomonadaceae bacterium]|nr:glycosyltransferase [Pyrinomonadaceae bacterium]
MNNNGKSKALRGRDIVCFPQDWTGDPLSKTHIMRILARENRVLWVNSIGLRAPSVSTADFKRSFEKLARAVDPMKEVEPNLFVMSPLSIPAYGSAAIRKFNQRSLLWQIRRSMRKLGFKNPVNYTFLPSAALLARKLGEDFLIYHCVDEYSQFSDISTDTILKLEKELIEKSDLVVVSAEKLLEDKKDLHENTHLVRHGTDWAHFRTALDDDTQIRAEIKDLPRPIIGFHGLLADWVDFELLGKTAKHFENGSVVLIGKVTADAAEMAKKIEKLPNVHFLGRKPYAELPAYCKAFDVALNPFAINDLTLAANPLKVREYLAAGLKVVSTDIPEVKILDHCLIGEDHARFIGKIEEALNDKTPREAISDSIKHESWEARVDEIRELIAKS